MADDALYKNKFDVPIIIIFRVSAIKLPKKKKALI